MSSDMKRIAALAVSVSMLISCSVSWKIDGIRRSELGVDVSLPDSGAEEECGTVLPVTSPPGISQDGPVIMNAVRDTETGEMVATDVISASKVVARFRNVAERAGKVTLEFDVSVPQGLTDSRWQLRLYPELALLEDRYSLDPVLVTGKAYRSAQLRGYERYRAFVSSLVEDSTDFIMMRSLEIFLRRHFPETYAMKNDTSYVPEPMAENIFGVRQKDALEHYTRHGLMHRNERRRRISERMLSELTGGIARARLDTVIGTSQGDVIYRYSQTVESRSGLRKIILRVHGGIFEEGKELLPLPDTEETVFYVSSLSSLADTSLRYVSEVVERNVYDYTRAVLDFESGSSEIDTASAVTVSELERIRRCLDSIFGMEELVADSVVITASCSMEGDYGFNSRLASERAEAVMKLLSREARHDSVFRVASVPENWDQFIRLAEADTAVSETSRAVIRNLDYCRDPDKAERQLSMLPEYRYFRERIYPMLRTVRLDFHMHRKGVVKDTVHTSEVDTLYMSGVEAMMDMDYRKAVAILGSYSDCNSALAYLSAGYEDRALDILYGLDQGSAKVNYLMALSLARLGRYDEAFQYFGRSVSIDGRMLHRGRLDPELHMIVNKFDASASRVSD